MRIVEFLVGAISAATILGLIVVVLFAFAS
jgi:hypothetical protein